MSIWTEVTIKANLAEGISLAKVFKAHCDETYVNIANSKLNTKEISSAIPFLPTHSFFLDSHRPQEELLMCNKFVWIM